MLNKSVIDQVLSLGDHLSALRPVCRCLLIRVDLLKQPLAKDLQVGQLFHEELRAQWPRQHLMRSVSNIVNVLDHLCLHAEMSEKPLISIEVRIFSRSKI